MGKRWWKWLFWNNTSIKLLLTCWRKLLMTVYEALPDGLKLNIYTYTQHVRLQHARWCHERFGIKLPKYPGKLKLSAFIIATSIMATISSSSSGSSLPSVSHWSGHPLTRSSRAAEQDRVTEARSSEDWYIQLFQQLVKCSRAAIDQTAV